LSTIQAADRIVVMAHGRIKEKLSLSLPDTPAMAEITLATLTQEQLDRLVRQLEDSALEIATLTAERDSARQQSTVNAPAPTIAPAQSEEPIEILSGTPTQHDSVGQRSGIASEGAAHSMPGMERNRAAPSPQEPREARRHVEFAVTSGEYAVTAPMPLKPQRPPCFDPSQRGGPTIQSRHLEFIQRDSPVQHVGCVVRRASGAFRADCGFDFGASEAAHLAAARIGFQVRVLPGYEFLGHVISEAGVEIDPKKLDTVKALHPPTNITELQSLLGFVNYMRRFVLDMARLTAPLPDLPRKGVAFAWGEKEHAAFSTLKNVLCSPPVLRIADPHRPFEVVTDASDIAIGAVLLQDFGNVYNPSHTNHESCTRPRRITRYTISKCLRSCMHSKSGAVT
ncbi:unnamed protein product, partial [Closterium sp. NIES-54]